MIGILQIGPKIINNYVEHTIYNKKYIMYNIETLIESTQQLYNDIDKCIDKLLRTKVGRVDKIETYLVYTEMESLMVATLQQLQCILDHLKNK